MAVDRPSPLSRHDLVPAAALGTVWLWLQHWIPRMPARVPVHWNAAGRVTGWIAPHDVFHLVLWLAGVLWGPLFVIGLLLFRRPGGAAFLVARGWIVGGAILMIGYILSMAAFQGQRALPAALGLLGICVVIGLLLAVRAARPAV